MRGFDDELLKLAAAGPANTIGKLLKGMAKTQRVKVANHPLVDTAPAPPSITVRPTDASTRSPDGSPQAQTLAYGSLGTVETPKRPIDKERFNRVFQRTK